jgi:hypothetical protein
MRTSAMPPILIIEDDPKLPKRLARTLQYGGFRLLHASNGLGSRFRGPSAQARPGPDSVPGLNWAGLVRRDPERRLRAT